MADDIMLVINTDELMKEIRERLGPLKSKAPALLANAINTTARKIRKQFVKVAKGQYEFTKKPLSGSPIKLTAGNATMPIERASAKKLAAILTAKGEMNDLGKFLVAPQTQAHGKDMPAAYAAQVLKASGLKALDFSPRPFITQFKSGHIAIVKREPGKMMKSNPKKEFIKKLLSPAVPHMLGNAEQRQMAAELFNKEIYAQVDKQIKRVLEKNGIKEETTA